MNKLKSVLLWLVLKFTPIYTTGMDIGKDGDYTVSVVIKKFNNELYITDIYESK